MVKIDGLLPLRAGPTAGDADRYNIFADIGSRRIVAPPSREEWRRMKLVLVGCRWGIGDLISELPALEALRAATDAHVIAVGARASLSLLHGRGIVDETLAVQDVGFGHLGDDADTTRLRSWVAGREFDVAVDMLHVPAGVRGVLWNASRRRVDAAQPAEVAATQRGLGIPVGVAWGARVGWNVSVPPDVRPRLAVLPGGAEFADRVLAELGYGPDDRPGVVSPAASVGIKRWPAARFAAVAEALARRTGCPTLAVVGPQRALADELLAGVRPGTVRVLPAASLSDTAAVLARCSTFVGNDTGPSYLAQAAGCPTVSIFGPTDPDVLRQGQMTCLGGVTDCPHRVTGRYGIPPCWHGDGCLIGERSCIEAVTTDEVIAALPVLQ